MILGFMDCFEPMVSDHSKRHTIRRKRKRPVRVGDRCDCYVNPRQKTMRLLGRWPCVKVEDVRIDLLTGKPARVLIEGIELDTAERNALAWADGFRSSGRAGAFDEMCRFWIGTHAKGKERLRFHGESDSLEP